MKISRADSKLHDQAMDLIHSDKTLTQDEIEFCLENFNPMATHDVGKGGIFFTPIEMARSFAQVVAPNGRIIDLCAGIGLLSWALLENDRFSPRQITEIVAVEIDNEFAEIGKRLLPEVTWICGSIFDQELVSSLGRFDYAIGNPPYGNIPNKKEADWMSFKGPAQFMAAEIAFRVSANGCMFIVPEGDTEYDLKRNRPRKNANADRLKTVFPGVTIMPESLDLSEFKSQWKGAAPDVAFADFIVDEAIDKMPIGFRKPKAQLERDQLLKIGVSCLTGK